MISSAVVAQFIKGLKFPATKEECAGYAARKRAPRAVIEAILAMPGEKYITVGEFWNSFAKLAGKAG
ncbi:MAG: DUF2795 domain-containing protein [Actinobacteria bacterium]|nr:DUF2795 domain-containing protein [Actinomycetota bacterium]